MDGSEVQLDRAKRTMPARWSRALALRKEGLTLLQIAERLGISTGRAGVIVRNAERRAQELVRR